MLFVPETSIIRMMWHGSELSSLERLSIVSHIKAGHEVHLYCYQDVGPIPDGVILHDGREILPENEIFFYRNDEEKGSFSAFSNCFRYKVLYECGGWWSDTDVICIKPFNFTKKYVFASEKNRNGTNNPTTCVIKAPINSEIMKSCYEESIQYEKSTLRWGTIGPKLLEKNINICGLNDFVLPVNTFCPYDWFLSEVDPEGDCLSQFDLNLSHAVHLWQEMWRRSGLNKNMSYNPNSLFERLKHAIL